MNPIHLRCPRCGTEMELELEGEANMVLLGCSGCKTPIMHYYGETMVVDGVEFPDLEKSQLKAVNGFLRMRPGKELEGSDEETEGETKGEPARVFTSASHQMGEAVRDEGLSADDLTNLRIDLETSEDVLDFLEKL